MIKCDVLIVGSGPAGASLVYFLSANKLRIILIDKKKIIEQPVRCAEFATSNIIQLFDFNVHGINNSINYMDIYVGFYPPPEITATVSSPGYILDRAKFVGNIIERFKNEFVRSLNHALSKRLYLTKYWPEQFTNISRTRYSSSANESNSNEKVNTDLFLNLIRKTWITFKEYWKEII